MDTFKAPPMNALTPVRWRLVSLFSIVMATMLLSSCSNFDERKRYWDLTMTTTLKGASRAQVKSFAKMNGHEEYIFSGSGSYIVDQASKGALWNSRGRLFVNLMFDEDRVATHWFETSMVLH
jgi:hypothetical protein